MELEIAAGATECRNTRPVWDDMPEWRALHRRLREYSRRRAALDAAEAFDLLRAEQVKLHAYHGYVTIYEYMERELGYGPHAAHERLRVARALAQLPATAAALSRGDLMYSAVRELSRVATTETEADWLAASKGMTVNQVERLVTGHLPGDRPDDPTTPALRPRVVRIEMPPEVYALWRQARSVIADERGKELDDGEFVEALCRAAIAPGSGAEAPANQIAYLQCPDCRRATQNGAGREIEVAPEVLDRAACDARILGSLDADPPERAMTTVTPRLREQVFARDHRRCTVPGCRAARNLDVHHIIEQSRGGPHELWNLTVMCSGHHAALHAGLLEMRGEAPYGIQFRWVHGPPMPPGLDPPGRRAYIRQCVEEIFGEADPPL